MRYDRVHLRHAPGFTRSLDPIELDAGLTFIVGPNASGKSTLARTMRLALWAEKGAPSIDATVDCRAEHGAVESVELRSGAASSRASFVRSDSSVAGLYRLGLAELLRTGNAADREFASRLQAELHGGIPVGKLRDEIAERSGYSRKVRTQLADAVREVQEAQRVNTELLGSEKELQRLVVRREEAATADEIAQVMARLQSALDLSEELQSLDMDITAIPAGVESIRHDDLENKKELESRLRDAQRALEIERDRLNELREEWEDTDPVWRELEVASLDHGQRLLNQKGEAEREIAFHEEELRSAENTQAAARDQLFAGPLRRPLSTTDREKLKTAYAAVRQRRAESMSLARTVDYFAAFEAESRSLGKTQRHIQALRDWLRAPRVAETSAPPSWLAMVSLALSGAVLANVVYALSEVDWQSLWLTLAAVVCLASIALSFWLWTLMKRAAQRDDSSPERSARRAAEQVGLELTEWTEASALQALNRLEEELVQRREAERVHHRVTELRRRQAALDEALSTAEAELEQAAGALGLSKESLELEAAEIFYRTEHWISAEVNAEQARTALETWRERLASLSQSWAEWLERHRLRDQAERVGDEALIEVARDRLEQVATLSRGLAETEKSVTREESLVRIAEGDVQSLRDRLGDWAASDVELERGIEHHAQLRELRADYQSVQKRLGREVEALSEDAQVLRDRGIISTPNLSLGSLPSIDREKVARCAREAREQAEELGELIAQTARLEVELANASGGHRLEDAFAALEVAKAASADMAEQRGMAALEQAMLDWSTRTAGGAGASDALHSADAWLRKFTHGRFGLRLSVDGVLVGVDLHAKQDRALEALSDATRVQAQLAARLAAIEEAEAGGERVPLVLDEVFSTTDPVRFEAIASALSELVRAGRQIIYLTADRGECTRWQTLAREQDLVEPHVVEIGEITAAVVSGVSVPEQPDVSPPNGQSAQKYAQALGLEPPTMHQSAESWSVLWLLSDDLDAVWSAISQRWDSVGQALSMARVVGDERVWGESREDPAAITARLTRRLDALRRMQARWSRGVASGFRWEDALQSGAITDAYAERALDAYERASGDPEAFIEMVADFDRFRRANVESLREHFMAEGILPELSRASAAELSEAALGRPARSGFDARDVAWVSGMAAEVAG